MLDVASYRLAIHLGLAFVILGLLAWYIFKLGRTEAAAGCEQQREDERGGEQSDHGRVVIVQRPAMLPRSRGLMKGLMRFVEQGAGVVPGLLRDARSGQLARGARDLPRQARARGI